MGTEHIQISKIISNYKDQSEFEREINFWVSEGYRVASRSNGESLLNGKQQVGVTLVRP